MNVVLMDMGQEVRGESKLPGHEGKIELMAFSHGVAMQVVGDIGSPERTSGRPIHQDFTVTKYLDASAPILNISCCQGKLFPRVDIVVGRQDGGAVVEAMRYTLRNVVISSISVAGGGDRPLENLTLNYNKITWKFSDPMVVADKQAAIERTWNLEQNVAG